MRTTIAVAVCPRCGTTEKSGKMSCCGRGGSWFRNCGGGGNTKLHHTWSEGIQVCKTRSQSKKGISQGINVDRRKVIDFSQVPAVITATNTFAFASVNTATLIPDAESTVTSTYTPDNVPITPTNTILTSPTHTSAGTSVTTQVRANVLIIAVYSNILFIVGF